MIKKYEFVIDANDTILVSIEELNTWLDVQHMFNNLPHSIKCKDETINFGFDSQNTTKFATCWNSKETDNTLTHESAEFVQ